ncbi:MAG TPA: maleylpyruvate isomerase family mycothiol-dependent enzyme [Acidimicrobiales bacterium]
MDLDYSAVIRDEGERALAALAADADGTVSWCGDWRVRDVVAHIGSGHHMTAQIVAGRPTTDMSVRATLTPPEDDGLLAEWVGAGTTGLLDQLAASGPDDDCWSWYPEDQTVGFWARRMAHETLVHRWDAERGAGVAPEPMDPVVAADGIDEMLEVFVGLTRVLFGAPGGGESAHLHCTDTDGEWLITFPAPSERVVTREHVKGDVAFRGPAETLLLFLWGRDGGEVDTVGDSAVADRWRELVPPM